MLAPPYGGRGHGRKDPRGKQASQWAKAGAYTLHMPCCWPLGPLQLSSLLAADMSPARRLRLIFLKLAVWCQVGEKQGAVQLKHVFVLGFQAPTLFSKLITVKEENKLVTCIHPLTQKGSAPGSW